MATIQVEHLSFSYPSSFDPIFTDVSLRLDTGWKLGFVGRNGRGKTTFLKLLLGEYEYSGSIASPAPFVYFPCPAAEPGRPTAEVLRGIAPAAADWQLERELSLLGVRPDALERPFSTLSSGERTKALLACLFLQEGAFPLIDEPTNHLDACAGTSNGWKPRPGGRRSGPTGWKPARKGRQTRAMSATRPPK